MVSLMSVPVFASGVTKKDIAPGELNQRIAVIKRFKELLKAQRERFLEYLDSLEKQKDVIQRGTADEVMHHVELEEKIITDIFSIQKVIDPLEEMYHSTRQDTSRPELDEVSGLKDTLENLKGEAVIRSERNKELLSQRLIEIRSEIKSLRSNPYTRRRISNIVTPTQIDIRG